MESSGSGRGASALLLSVIVLAAGCASAQPPAAQAGQSPASQSALASAQPGPSASARPSPQGSAQPGRPASAQPGSAASAQPARIRALAARYLAIARPANHRLEVEVDGFGDHRRDDLAKAAADLRAEAATERHFDRQLARIRFPAAIDAIARALIRANRRRIALTRREARSASLAGLKTFTRRHKEADAAVQSPVRKLRKALGLPPPATS
jgi:hypothetical protein